MWYTAMQNKQCEYRSCLVTIVCCCTKTGVIQLTPDMRASLGSELAPCEPAGYWFRGFGVRVG